jgi:hypothetical protein
MNTDLRQMFEEGVDREVPHDLAERVVTGARARRRQRFVVGGAVLATAAVVLGVIVATNDTRPSTEPRPTDVAALPEVLPTPSGLSELSPGTMDAASTAYVVDNRLVLVDAGSAKAYVYQGIANPTGDSSQIPDGGALRPYAVRLSPDGTSALVAMRFESSQRLLGIRIAVLDVPTGESSLETLQLTDAEAEGSWLEYALMAWAPDSRTAYCVCHEGGQSMGVWSITLGDSPEGAFYTRVSDQVPAQISAGAGGLAVQLESYGGAWELRADGYLNRADLGPAESLSLSYDVPTAFAGVTNGWFAIQDLRQRPQQIQWERLPAGPVSSIQAAGSDYLLVSRPEGAAPGEPAPPEPLVVHVISKDAAPKLLTTFPAGTTSTSFAAQSLP